MVLSAGTNVAEFQANWTSPPQAGSGTFSSDQRSGSLSDGSQMSVSNQHRHSTGSDMTQHQHQDSPVQPPSQQSGQPSGTPHTPVGYPPSNGFPPPRTPLAQRGSSPSKQVPMGMAMTAQGLMGSPTVQGAHLPQSPFLRAPSVASPGTPASPFPQHFADPPYSQERDVPPQPERASGFDVLSDLIAAGGGSVDKPRPLRQKLVQCIENDDAYLLVVNEADIHWYKYLTNCGVPLFNEEFVLMAILRHQQDTSTAYRVKPQTTLAQPSAAAAAAGTNVTRPAVQAQRA